jgi:mono/diheme cytochrome c family protein
MVMKMRTIHGTLVVGALVVGAAILPSVKSAYAQDAKGLYTSRCAACHGDTGKGDGPAGKFLKPPPSDFKTSTAGKTDAWLAKSISDGGPSVGLPATMPAYKDLSADQVNSLIAYVKQLASK